MLINSPFTTFVHLSLHSSILQITEVGTMNIFMLWINKSGGQFCQLVFFFFSLSVNVLQVALELVPFKDGKHFKPRPQSNILVLLVFHSKFLTSPPAPFMMESPAKNDKMNAMVSTCVYLLTMYALIV